MQAFCTNSRPAACRASLADSGIAATMMYLANTGRAYMSAACHPVGPRAEETMALDDKTRTELEAAAFRRLLDHLNTRSDVQNIDMMNLAGFCRNCLSNWMKEAADAKGVPMTKDESRQAIYGMPFEEWKAQHQKEASPEQKAAFQKASQKH
jgi:hypothetical protein